jgi:hypothetical protein
MNPEYKQKPYRKLPSILELIDYLIDLAVERGKLEERLTSIRKKESVV